MTRPAAALLLTLVAACGGAAAPITLADATTTTVTTTTPPGTTTTGDVTTTMAATTTTMEAAAVVIELEVLAAGPQLRVAGGERPLGYRVEVTRGDLIRIVTRGEVADDVHVHTYDREIPVVPGSEQVLEFTADIPGVFEVELHDGHRVVFRLVVS